MTVRMSEVHALRLEGKSWKEVADHFGYSSIGAVSGGYTKWRRNQDRKREYAMRKCLSCSKPFRSWGAGNRICQVCKSHRSVFKGGGDLGGDYEW